MFEALQGFEFFEAFFILGDLREPLEERRIVPSGVSESGDASAEVMRATPMSPTEIQLARREVRPFLFDSSPMDFRSVVSIRPTWAAVEVSSSARAN